MAKDGDMSLYNDVLQPFLRIINNDPPKDKLASTNLNFSDSNQSLKGSSMLSPRRKRQSSALSDETPRKTARYDFGGLPALSPWECNRMKAEALSARTEVEKLQMLLDQQNTIRKEMQIAFDSEKDLLKMLHEKDEISIRELKSHVEEMRSRERETKSELLKVNQILQEERDKHSLELSDKQSIIEKHNIELRKSDHKYQHQIAELKKKIDELMMTITSTQADLERIRVEAKTQTAKADNLYTFKLQSEKQSLQIIEMNAKLEVLEREKSLHGDWDKENRAYEKRLSKMIELEKEVVILRDKEKFLKDALKNKLVSEQKLISLQSRIETLEPMEKELQDLNAKAVRLESALHEWTTMARSRGVTSARALTKSLEEELQREILSTTENNSSRTKIIQITEELATAKFEKDKAVAALTDLQKGFKAQESVVKKLQKRVLVVSRERDCYREQIDTLEKDLTVHDQTMTGPIMSVRMQQSEKIIQGYRDLLAKYDSEDNTKVVESLQCDVAKWRDMAESLKKQLVQLEKNRDDLQAHLEKHQYNIDTKVLHLAENPAAMAQRQIEAELENAQEEIKKLKAALRDGAKVCPDEIAQLKQQIDNGKLKLKRMKEEFTSSAQEYRDVCYMLLGYKVDRTGHKNYRISSMYAESSDEYLTFTLSDQGIEMVHTDYSESLTDLVELHLHQHQSFPVFLSALTTELFTRTTMQQEGLPD